MREYVVGWRLVERRQLSCVFCLGGVGDNVMFTLRLTRSCCYALLFVKYSVGTVGWGGLGGCWGGMITFLFINVLASAFLTRFSLLQVTV